MGDVLVVDDEPGLRRALGALLRSVGYTVWHAGTLAEALETLAAQRISAVVVEPHVDGTDVTAFFTAARSLHPDLLIVASCASLSEVGQARLVAAGADVFVAKTDLSRALLPTLRDRPGRGTLPTLTNRKEPAWKS